MGCCGSKQVERDAERKPLLQEQEQKKPRPVISDPVFVSSSSLIPSSPLVREETRIEPGSTSIQAAGPIAAVVLPRQESVSSFADYDVLKRMKGVPDRFFYLLFTAL